MKRRGVQIATGLIFAGMLAMTGCGSTQSTGDTTTPDAVETETVQEVEVPMEQNESSLSDSDYLGEIGSISNYKSLEEVRKYYRENGFEYSKYVNVQGCNTMVLAIAMDGIHGDGNGNIVAEDVRFYTQKEGDDKVYLAGTLDAHDAIAITGNGVIVANSQSFTFETYFLSQDGTKLEHKDYIESNNQGGGILHSYRRNSNKEQREYYDGTQQDLQNYYNNTAAKYIIFN